MLKKYWLLFAFLLLSGAGNLFSQVFLGDPGENAADSLPANQILYNGRVWRNVYKGISGDPFLFSPAFMNGSVVINNVNFSGISLMYDIYKDEILTLSKRNIIIQLNKELVSEFTILYNNKEYRFLNNRSDTAGTISGYTNILYDGVTSVFVKYRKTVEAQSVDNVSDGFKQSYRIYVVCKKVPVQVKRKSQFLKLFREQSNELREYARREKLSVSWKIPESFVPLAKYRDSLINK